MKAQTLIRISGMTLLAIAVTLGVLAVIYVLQNPQVVSALATISWNS